MMWNKYLETGVESIDNQHKELYRRVDALLTAGRNRKGLEKIQETLDFLQDYVVEHFKDEYALMVESNYPQALEHKMYHDQYVRDFTDMRARYNLEGDCLNMVLVVNRNVVDWLTNHINIHDREFAKYYRKQMEHAS